MGLRSPELKLELGGLLQRASLSFEGIVSLVGCLWHDGRSMWEMLLGRFIREGRLQMFR